MSLEHFVPSFGTAGSVLVLLSAVYTYCYGLLSIYDGPTFS